MNFLKQYIKNLFTSILILPFLFLAIVALWAISIPAFDTFDRMKLTAAIMKEPDSGELYYRRATLRLNYANFREALSDLDKAILLLSDMDDPVIDMAGLYSARGDTYEVLITSPSINADAETKRKYYHSALSDYKKASQLYSEENHPSGVSSANSSIKRVQKEIAVLDLSIYYRNKKLGSF